MDELERRARLYAALGEPVRLSIVDRLVPGDLSPGELAADLGMASNLLAHHVNVLSDAGVIRRVRSEGDRRRSYLQLRLDDPAVRAATLGSAPPDVGDVARVLFVCTRNSARSQLAAASWRLVSGVPAASAGTRPADRVHPRAVAVGRRHGLSIAGTGTASVTDQLRPDDLVVAVCDSAHEELDRSRPRLHWSVPDPARSDTDDAFEEALLELTRRVALLAPGFAGQGQAPTTVRR